MVMEGIYYDLLKRFSCSSTCTLVSGYTCSGGDPKHPDGCYELCGDGINLGTEACDDGNSKNKSIFYNS